MKIKTRCRKCNKINHIDREKIKELISCIYCLEQFKFKEALKDYGDLIEKKKTPFLLKICYFIIFWVIMTVICFLMTTF